jgi:hypothetical protein
MSDKKGRRPRSLRPGTYADLAALPTGKKTWNKKFLKEAEGNKPPARAHVHY